ncbi:hypothetical protein PybrP1_009221 [[Pythium] brassicae (nom. inval.)]|nr:hypothetical protein PybrP1_009221 [[Pythium] brassicae (nom. inval.)]
MFASKELELQKLNSLNHTLMARCEMLDSIARETQEKLARERAEHSRYEDVLQRHLRASVDENAHLVAALTQLDGRWNDALHRQSNDDEEQHRDDYYAAESNTWGEGASYYSSYDDTGADSNSGLVFDQYAPHYSTDEPGMLTPTEETQGEAYYSGVYVGGTGGASINPSVQFGNNSPPVSPTRVGAVWNKFFENVAGANEHTQRSGGGYEPHRRAAPSIDEPAPQHELRQSRLQLEPPSAAFIAIRKAELTRLQKLLLSGMSPNARDVGEKGTPLHLACELGDVDAVRLLCEFGTDVEGRDEAGNTPLLVACSQGHYDCVVFLLQSAADLTAANTAGQTALHLAAWDGSADCVEILADEAGGSDAFGSDDSAHDQSDDGEGNEDNDSSSLELDADVIDALRHEPLKPPPEIEAELLRTVEGSNGQQTERIGDGDGQSCP